MRRVRRPGAAPLPCRRDARSEGPPGRRGVIVEEEVVFRGPPSRLVGRCRNRRVTQPSSRHREGRLQRCVLGKQRLGAEITDARHRHRVIERRRVDSRRRRGDHLGRRRRLEDRRRGFRPPPAPAPAAAVSTDSGSLGTSGSTAAATSVCHRARVQHRRVRRAPGRPALRLPRRSRTGGVSATASRTTGATGPPKSRSRPSRSDQSNNGSTFAGATGAATVAATGGASTSGSARSGSVSDAHDTADESSLNAGGSSTLSSAGDCRLETGIGGHVAQPAEASSSARAGRREQVGENAVRLRHTSAVQDVEKQGTRRLGTCVADEHVLGDRSRLVETMLGQIRAGQGVLRAGQSGRPASTHDLDPLQVQRGRRAGLVDPRTGKRRRRARADPTADHAATAADSAARAASGSAPRAHRQGPARVRAARPRECDPRSDHRRLPDDRCETPVRRARRAPRSSDASSDDCESRRRVEVAAVAGSPHAAAGGRRRHEGRSEHRLPGRCLVGIVSAAGVGVFGFATKPCETIRGTLGRWNRSRRSATTTTGVACASDRCWCQIWSRSGGRRHSCRRVIAARPGRRRRPTAPPAGRQRWRRPGPGQRATPSSGAASRSCEPRTRCRSSGRVATTLADLGHALERQPRVGPELQLERDLAELPQGVLDRTARA